MCLRRGCPALGKPLVEIGVVLLWVLSMALFQKLLNHLVRSGRISEFAARKAAHVGIGLWILPLALLVRRWYLAAIPIMMVLAANTSANRKRGQLRGGWVRLFPVATFAAPLALILYCWSRGRTDLVVPAVLTMTIGDTAAALAGMRFGRHKIPWTGKSLEGAAANWLASFATLWAAGAFLREIHPALLLVPAFAVAVLEAVLPGEWDNPLAIMLLIGCLAALS